MSRFAGLAAAGQSRLADPVEGVVLDNAAAAPSRLHAAAHDAVAQLLTKITAGADSLPFQYRAMLGVVRGTMVPTILARLDSTPEAELRGHLLALRDRIDAALSAEAHTHREECCAECAERAPALSAGG